MPLACEKPLSYCKIAYYMSSGSNRLRALHPLLTFLCLFLSFRKMETITIPQQARIVQEVFKQVINKFI